MNEELTELFMNYEKERKRIENEIKDKGLWETFGLDANEHFFKPLKKEVQKKKPQLEQNMGNCSFLMNQYPEGGANSLWHLFKHSKVVGKRYMCNKIGRPTYF